MVNNVKITLGTNNIKYPNKIQLWLVLTATVAAADDVAEFVLRLDIAAILSPVEEKKEEEKN